MHACVLHYVPMNVSEKKNETTLTDENVVSQENTSPIHSPAPKKKKKNIWKEILQFAALAVIIVLFRIYVAQPFIVNGQSMEPTFDNGQYLIVDQLSYHLEVPSRGDIVIFHYPKNPKEFFIKRVIGLPGEKVVIKSGIITIYNKEHPDGFTLSEPYIEFTKHDNFTEQLTNSELFVMGDNRANSSDSRVWGPLDLKYLVGRPLIRLLPFQSASFLPGIKSY